MPSKNKRSIQKVSDDEAEDNEKQSSKTAYLDLPPPGQNQQLSLELFQSFKDQIEAKLRVDFGDISSAIRGIIAPLPAYAAPVPAGAQHSAARARAKVQDEHAAKTEIERPEQNKKMTSSFVRAVHPSFLTYISNDNAPGGARELYDRGDLHLLMPHFHAWYERAMGFLPAVAGVRDESLAKKARTDFDRVHQWAQESVESFIKRFESNTDLVLRLTGAPFSESAKAFEFLTKLNLKIYGTKLEALKEEEQTQLRFLAATPGVARLPARGYPQTYNEAVT